MTLDLASARDALQALHYQELYVKKLGWNVPTGLKMPAAEVEEGSYSLIPIAEMSGVFIIEVHPRLRSGKIPQANSRRKIAQDLAKTIHKHLLIFLDGERTQSLWYLLRRRGDSPREHLYVKGQSGEPALGKLKSIISDLAELEKSAPDVLEVAHKLKNALDVERVTKRFYEDFKKIRNDFASSIHGIDDERDRHRYVSVLLNRSMFLYFLQQHSFLDNDDDYLQKKMLQVQNYYGSDRFYTIFLHLLFFEGLALPREEWSDDARRLLGQIKYLKSDLFLKHRIEQDWPAITIPDIAFTKLLAFFAQYTWHLTITPGGRDNELSPHVLGYTFEKYIDQKSFGAYYTCPEITDYLCESTIHRYILQRMNELSDVSGSSVHRQFDNLGDLLLNLDAPLCRELLRFLPTIHILDPACGSGAFLVSALNTLADIYHILIGKIEMLHDAYLTNWLAQARSTRASINFYIRKKVITENIFGVDLMEEAIEIVKFRLFITLISSVEDMEQSEPWPDIDFNILPGNSLIGFLHINEERLSQFGLPRANFNQLVARKNLLISQYKGAARAGEDLRSISNLIDQRRQEANAKLNWMLLDEFRELGVKYEEATWNASRQVMGKTTRRDLRFEDITNLHPFHWGYEFDEIMETYGGFDIIITNPPWEALKPQAKEFFAFHENTITKNKMRIEDFEQEQSRLLLSEATRQEWLEYQNAFSYQSSYFRSSPQYSNQISIVNGKKQGTDLNLYKLFTEQCYNLLRADGLCGLVVPSGIYTDLGSKQLREMLFTSTRVISLFCFENRKNVFAGVDSRFKFVILTYQKGHQTTSFPAAFMLHDVNELVSFPLQGAQSISVEFIRLLSPDSLSVVEFKNDIDSLIAQKMQKFPLLGERLTDTWNLVLETEFHMTNHHNLFKTEPAFNRLPLYEGKMIHQFTHTLRPPRYWIEEKDGRAASLGRNLDRGQNLNYQYYRLGYRSIGRTTDQRALIACILPAFAFAGNSLILTKRIDSKREELITNDHLLFIAALMNSFVLDYLTGQKISANLNMFYIYQLPVPRLTAKNLTFNQIVQRAARLTCTTPEFAELWQAIFPDSSWSPDLAAISPVQRASLRAEVDGLVAHLYQLSEEEFHYILDSFPRVEQSIKDATLQAYKDLRWSYCCQSGTPGNGRER